MYSSWRRWFAPFMPGLEEYAVAVAEEGRGGKIRLGRIENWRATIKRL
jgi:hypothetical protein